MIFIHNKLESNLRCFSDHVLHIFVYMIKAENDQDKSNQRNRVFLSGNMDLVSAVSLFISFISENCGNVELNNNSPVLFRTDVVYWKNWR